MDFVLYKMPHGQDSGFRGYELAHLRRAACQNQAQSGRPGARWSRCRKIYASASEDSAASGSSERLMRRDLRKVTSLLVKGPSAGSLASTVSELSLESSETSF